MGLSVHREADRLFGPRERREHSMTDAAWYVVGAFVCTAWIVCTMSVVCMVCVYCILIALKDEKRDGLDGLWHNFFERQCHFHIAF